jgi:hypothetical protein
MTYHNGRPVSGHRVGCQLVHRSDGVRRARRASSGYSDPWRLCRAKVTRAQGWLACEGFDTIAGQIQCLGAKWYAPYTMWWLCGYWRRRVVPGTYAGAGAGGFVRDTKDRLGGWGAESCGGRRLEL